MSKKEKSNTSASSVSSQGPCLDKFDWNSLNQEQLFCNACANTWKGKVSSKVRDFYVLTDCNSMLCKRCNKNKQSVCRFCDKPSCKQKQFGSDHRINLFKGTRPLILLCFTVCLFRHWAADGYNQDSNVWQVGDQHIFHTSITFYPLQVPDRYKGS